MSVFFVTPCYGGQMTAATYLSYERLFEELDKQNVQYDSLTVTNESLITRARDTSVATFWKTDYDRLMFIDADIEFQPDDVAKLWNLDADVGVAAYPMKRPERPPVTAWKDGKLVELKDLSGQTEVDYAGTGFMMIKRNVFHTLRSLHPEWKYEEGHVGECWGFFQDPIEDGIKLSEDYFFCKRVREAGMKVMLDPSIKLYHWGMYRYG